ncbi:uncharacterized protein LOC113780894 [Coffea eugenioides]|uniref:uncharacterized protein LOC113780894 n=1 Tax=Coffea eugenioides TaxID=49369 RepID=UPI000F604DAD|nr:uncharacterized protein LOC113780894 [Coffea eugenioides]
MVLSENSSSDESFQNLDNNETGDLIVPDSESEQEMDHLKEVLRNKMWTYNPREDIEFKKGQLFTNVDAFRAALKDYVIQKGFHIKRLKNEKTRCTAICDVAGCTWRIHASPIANSVTFMIKTYTHEHTCVMDNKNRKATFDWMAKKLIAVRTYPNLSRKGIEAEMLKYGVHPNKQQVYRAKQKAREEIEGTHSESYSKLSKYVVLLRQHNPGNVYKIHYDRPNLLVEPRFLRLFISFKSQKDGFLGSCRSFVGFDGCHLKGSFGGVLLAAVALDGNNSIFSIAFAIVEVENKETWRVNIVYEQLLPSAIGRYCCRHISMNFKSQFPGVLLSTFFWQAAKSYDAIGFTQAMQRIKVMNIEAWRYLSKIPVSTWARHAFSTDLKCDHVTNNFTESFNAWIGDLGCQPILTLVEGLRKNFMKKLHKRYQKACTWTSAIPKNIIEKLKKIVIHSRRCSLQMASEDLFEVTDGDRTFIVSLNQKTCDCGAFQLSRLPCKHAALGIVYRRQKLETYCDPCFSTEMYLKTYSGMIHPIPHEKRWPPLIDVTPKTVFPPPLRRAPGRPRVNRRRGPDEPSQSQAKRSTTMRCGNCKATGHNTITCQRTPGTQFVRGKPGRGIANTGLAGSVLWDHADGNVPIVVSSQGSNPSSSTQSPLMNADLNLQTATNATKRKRGRPSNKSAPSVVYNPKRKTSTVVPQPFAGMHTAALHPSGSAQVQTDVNINASVSHDSHNVSSSFTF